MKKLLIIPIIFICIAASKKEDEEPKYCWIITSWQLIAIKTVCDKTSVQMLQEYPDGWYYRSDELRKCWVVNSNNHFIKDCHSSLIRKLIPNSLVTETDCNYCAFWYYREKRRYQQTNQLTYSSVVKSNYPVTRYVHCIQGREIFLRESLNSLITGKFSVDGITW